MRVPILVEVTRLGARVAAVLSLVFVATAGFGLSPETGTMAYAASVQDDLDAVLRDGSFQTDLPEAPEPEEPRPPPETPVEYSGDALKVLGYFFLICLIVFTVAVLGREIARLNARRRRGAGEGARAPAMARRPVIDRAAGGDALARADALASRGDIPGAIRLLLLTGIDALSRRAEAETDASRTSREILDIAPLARESRAAFTDLIRAEEHAHFAARPADMTLFRTCRASFERFVASENTGGGA